MEVNKITLEWKNINFLLTFEPLENGTFCMKLKDLSKNELFQLNLSMDSLIKLHKRFRQFDSTKEVQEELLYYLKKKFILNFNNDSANMVIHYGNCDVTFTFLLSNRPLTLKELSRKFYELRELLNIKTKKVNAYLKISYLCYKKISVFNKSMVNNE